MTMPFDDVQNNYLDCNMCCRYNLLHSERPKLHTILAFLSAIGLKPLLCLLCHELYQNARSIFTDVTYTCVTKGRTLVAQYIQADLLI